MSARTQASLIFRLDAVQPAQVAEKILYAIRASNLPPKVEVYGKTYPLKELVSAIKASGKAYFNIELPELLCFFAPNPDNGYALIQIEQTKDTIEINWEGLIHEFSGFEGFRQAWISDVGYEYWQNAEDPLEYELEGVDYTNLTLRSNGLPPPLDQMIIDISDNPRRIIRDGYVEAIGSTMWLGQEFWSLVGDEHKERLLLSGIARIDYPSTNVMRVQVADEPFTDASNEGLQRNLRELLYG